MYKSVTVDVKKGGLKEKEVKKNNFFI